MILHTRRLLRIAIVTARKCASSRTRCNDPQSLGGFSVDEAFFLGGMEKHRILNNLAPHIMFFDDQISHSRVAGQ